MYYFGLLVLSVNFVVSKVLNTIQFCIKLQPITRQTINVHFSLGLKIDETITENVLSFFT